MHRKSYKRAERKEQVINTLLVDLQHGREPKATAARLARLLDITPSNHFNGILKEMVRDGLLQVERTQHRPNVMKSIYRLPDGHYSIEPRKIQVNCGAKQLVLEMT